MTMIDIMVAGQDMLKDSSHNIIKWSYLDPKLFARTSFKVPAFATRNQSQFYILYLKYFIHSLI